MGATKRPDSPLHFLGKAYAEFSRLRPEGTDTKSAAGLTVEAACYEASKLRHLPLTFLYSYRLSEQERVIFKPIAGKKPTDAERAISGWERYIGRYALGRAIQFHANPQDNEHPYLLLVPAYPERGKFVDLRTPVLIDLNAAAFRNTLEFISTDEGHVLYNSAKALNPLRVGPS